jgi:pimeloyl-ACP methyl ester carboxylesterase
VALGAKVMFRGNASPLARWTWCEATADDVMMRYAVGGEGPPLLLLHGLSGSARWWERNAVPLAGNFRVHVVDLIHFCGPAPRPGFILEKAARRLAGWMTSAGLERAFVAGHSMGGHIAAELAADFPGLVARLVLVAPAVLFPARYTKLSMPSLIRRAPHVPFSLVRVLVEDAMRAGPLALWQATRDLLGRDVRDKLPLVTAPTLLVWGARDGILPATMAEQVQALIPRCELRLFRSAGHIPMWEEPQEFNETVREFLLNQQEVPPE